jgi:hypothetical protein
MYGDTLKEYRNRKMQQFLSAFISFFSPSWTVWARILIKTSKTASFQQEIERPFPTLWSTKEKDSINKNKANQSAEVSRRCMLAPNP